MMSSGVGLEYGPLPETLRHGRITFLLNFGLKYLLWILYILPKPFNKVGGTKGQGGGGGGPSLTHS